MGLWVNNKESVRKVGTVQNVEKEQRGGERAVLPSQGKTFFPEALGGAKRRVSCTGELKKADWPGGYDRCGRGRGELQ